ncbi:hypothetical protein CJ240_05440 [Varibaculum cambriense]|uniref:Uncharacterized protein n=1 Tax=Varibaculum cambriense TaxID=184870 RepID=A0ABX4UWW6_9ACTO|nr:hypothetical protein CJ240_05440 [Varibaculum cambriense]
MFFHSASLKFAPLNAIKSCPLTPEGSELPLRLRAPFPLAIPVQKIPCFKQEKSPCLQLGQLIIGVAAALAQVSCLR